MFHDTLWAHDEPGAPIVSPLAIRVPDRPRGVIQGNGVDDFYHAARIDANYAEGA